MSDSYDVVIIGAGPGGYVAAIRSGQLKLKTLLIEKEDNLGGTCLNVGCIPSKTLLHYSEQFYEDKTHRSHKGLSFSDLKMDLSKLMETKSGVIKGLNMGIGSLLKKNKVEHKIGHASFIKNNELEIKSSKGTEKITSKNIIIATGSAPIELPGLPFDEEKIISSTGALKLKKVPKNLVVIGAGVIGLELGSVYKRLGSEVTFIEALSQIGGNLDSSISKALQKTLTKQGLVFHLDHKVMSAAKEGGRYKVKAESKGGDQKEFDADVVLVSIGRSPNTESLNLEAVGIKKDAKGFIGINAEFQTSIPNVYAIGDVVEGPMLAHKASEEGVAIIEKIAGHKPSVNYMTIPSVIYTAPEVATVGFTADEAKGHGITPKVGSFPFMANSRAHCVDAKDGLVQVVVEESTDKIIGMHIMSEHAGEMIALGSLCIQKGVTAKELGQLCFAHPTFSEAIKEAALSVHKEAIHF